MQPLRVDLRVHDLDRAAWFYEHAVGLERDGASFRAPGGPELLRLRADGVTAPAPGHAAGLFHTAVRFPTRADLAAALRRVAVSKARFTGASDHGVSEALYLDDPSGNGVELYWDRPREVRPDDMFTAPLDLADLAAAGGETEGAPPGTDIGHVHLRVSELARAVAYYVGELGFEVMHRYGDQAAFVANDGYHHDVGLNTWHSRGAPLAPPTAAGLDRVVFREDGREVHDPDGIALVA